MQETPSIQNKIKFNYKIEALRGVAAILVVWGHATGVHSRLDPVYLPANNWFHTGSGHASVLIFFVLSGYVIGLTNRVPLTLGTILIYLKKRFVRIYPIYFLCLLLALLVSTGYQPASTILSHLTMTQELFSPTIAAISPSWSLVYEIIFYLLFIPISYYTINPLLVALICVGAGCANAYLYSDGYGSAIMPSYFFGFAFWLSGLVLAKYLDPKPGTITTHAYLLSFLLLFVALDKFDAPFTIFYRAGLLLFGRDLSAIPNHHIGVIAFRDLGCLLYYVPIVALFTSKELGYRKQFLSTLILLPALTFGYYFKQSDASTLYSILVASTCYIISAIVFFFPTQTESWAHRIVKKLEITGSISYGLYIAHFPILYLFGRIHFFSGSLTAYVVRLGCFLILSYTAAWWLEKKFQPWAKALLF